MSSLKESSTCPDGYRALNTSELTELLQNDDKMDQIIRLNETFQDLQVDRETLMTSNRSLAEESLAQRPRLNNGKLQLAEKYRELSKLATKCWEKQSQLDARVQKNGLQTVQNLLQEEVARAEEHSEELLEKFMEGNVSLDEFLDSFQSSRKTYHIRRAQAEKMQEIAQAKRQPSKTKEESKVPEVRKDSEHVQEPHRPNGFVAQGPLRVFQVRYGLTPAILLPHYPVSPPASAPVHQSSTPPPEPQLGQTHILSPSTPLPGHGQPVGLRVIGQLSGGWPANGRPVRVQQLYRPNPQQPEPPYR
ncbi:vacuolar protein sorting-associated protein 37D-like [Seriola lalandi dorsalis]|uniref:vacuolar protein sorting-associated protein 37D-like n=1 Tax=Seriola lalandi dorsalis TaxID=1841481 RepID=UPI000C6F4BE3|nr:vacuolar protein sorting-associated protein 37D-like [Seriola lalandi dorsalis]XP_056253680.1 vacuolar protein sorting-associated protein 37D [Seriola aureovittata]